MRAEHASQPVACVLVDEAQFLTREQVARLERDGLIAIPNARQIRFLSRQALEDMIV